MESLFLDDAKRKRIVSAWIPICLSFLHAWASAIVVAVTVFDRHNDTIDKMFSTCGWGIAILVFLLISNQGLELVRIFISSRISGTGQVIEKTTTEKTVVTPATETVKNVDIQAENVQVTN